MFLYYLNLATRSLKRSKVLTVLMILILGLGIGAFITTLSVVRLLSGDPLPQKSARLFYPQVDPFPKDQPFSRSGKMPWLMSYTDAMALLHAKRGQLQAAMAMADVRVRSTGTDQRPFYGNGVMTTTDFFQMFDVPFRYGSGWTATAEQQRAHVAVIAGYLNDRLFGGADSVGRSIRINGHDFRIVGVLRHWAPQPRFYAIHLGGSSYGKGDGVFMPLQSARSVAIKPKNVFTYGDSDGAPLESSKSIWLGVWVQVANAAQAADYRTFLAHYAEQQQTMGRFQRSRTALPGMMQWIHSQHVVPDDVRIQTYLAFGFLLICVINTVGLLMAKCLRRRREIGVRRALGATRRAIFAQFLVESGLVGLVGGFVGLGFAELGLAMVRMQPAQYASLAHLNPMMFLLTFLVGLAAALVAGLLPAWLACAISPAPQLKSI